MSPTTASTAPSRRSSNTTTTATTTTAATAAAADPAAAAAAAGGGGLLLLPRIGSRTRGSLMLSASGRLVANEELAAAGDMGGTSLTAGRGRIDTVLEDEIEQLIDSVSDEVRLGRVGV